MSARTTVSLFNDLPPRFAGDVQFRMPTCRRHFAMPARSWEICNSPESWSSRPSSTVEWMT